MSIIKSSKAVAIYAAYKMMFHFDRASFLSYIYRRPLILWS